MRASDAGIDTEHPVAANLIDGRYSLEDLIDLDRLREVLEDFSQATSFTTGLATYPDQKILVATGWRDACTRFHRASSESAVHCHRSNVDLTAGLREHKECNLSPCSLGLVEGATPVLVKDQHVASLFTGQVLFDKPDAERFRRQAAEYGYDPGDYLAALSEVPIVTELQLHKTLSALAGIASMIGEQGLANLKLKESTQALAKEIAEREAAEQGLRQSEEQFRLVLESTADGILVTNTDGKVIHTNGRFLEMWPIPPDLAASGDDNRLLEHVLEQLADPEDFLSGVRRLYNSTERSLDTLHFKDGRVFERYSCPLSGSDGLSGRVWSFRNITERKHADKRLIESERRSHAWLEYSPVCTKVVDPDFNLKYMSAAGIEALKIDDIEQFYGKPYPFSFYPDSFRDRMTENLEKAKETGETITQEASVVDTEGKELWYHSTIVPVNDDEGRIDYIMILSVETTERKRAEEALAESEERFRKLFQLAPLGYQSLDQHGNFLEVNQTWCQTLGYSREEVIGRNFAEFIDPGFKDIFERCFPMFKDAGSIDGVEHTMIKKDGTKIVASFVGRIGCNDDGSFKQTHCIFADVTERKEAERERLEYSRKLQAVNRQLQARQQELEEFTYTVSHNLKAPVVSISGFVALLSERIEAQLDSTGRRYLERIEGNTRTMEDLLRDLLELSRIGRVDEEIALIDMDAMADDIIGGFAVAATPRSIALRRLGSLPSRVARGRRIKQVLTNLVDNSIKYMRDGVEGKVEIGYDCDQKDPSGRAGAFFVRDNGRGIARELHAKIFNLFQRGPGSNAIASGTGVGLTASRRIIETHGGHLWCESALDQGSTFFFSLPSEPSQLNDAAPGEDERILIPAAPDRLAGALSKGQNVRKPDRKPAVFDSSALH